MKAKPAPTAPPVNAAAPPVDVAGAPVVVEEAPAPVAVALAPPAAVPDAPPDAAALVPFWPGLRLAAAFAEFAFHASIVFAPVAGLCAD